MTDDENAELLNKNAESSVDAALESADANQATPIRSLDAKRGEVELEGLRDDVQNKDLYAKAILVAMGVQLIVVDGIFFWYCLANHWTIPASAINTWLGATIVQIIGVVLVVAHYLFPNRDGRSGGT